MKSTLQTIALLSSILLIVSCSDSSSNTNVGVTSTTPIPVAPPAPTNGVVGQAVKGVISGATVIVEDGEGAELTLTDTVTTQTDGSYSATFSAAAVTAGIVGPLLVTIDGTGATTVCDYDDPASTTDDCPIGDGTFAAFGDTYALPDGFTLHGMIADVPEDTDLVDPIVTMNLSPATTVAFELAATQGVTSSQRAQCADLPCGDPISVTAVLAKTANAQMMGILASITGISFTGQKLNEISLIDLTNPASVSAANAQSIALSAFAAAIVGQINTTETSIAAVLAKIRASITIDANGNVVITGNNLADISEKMAVVLASPALAAKTSAQQALQTANQNSALFRVAGTSTVTISQAEEVIDATSGLSLTKGFIAKVINIVNGVSATTGAGGIGVTGASATEVFADALLSVDNLSAREVTDAFGNLENALIAAEASLGAGATAALSNQAGTLSGTITKGADGTSVTLAEVSSTVINAATGITVVVAFPTGERTDTNATGIFSADSLTITTSQSVTTDSTDGTDPVVTTTVLETFTGSVAATFTDAGVDLDLGLTTLDLAGSVTTAAAPGTFTLELGFSELAGTAVQVADDFSGASVQPDVTGKYSATFGFGGLTTSFSGVIGSSPLAYALTFTDGTPAGTDTVMGSLTRVITAATASSAKKITDTNVLTDGAASLTLVFESIGDAAFQLTGPTVAETGGQAPAGQLTAGETVFGTVDANGIVRYSDGSVQSLPAAIN